MTQNVRELTTREKQKIAKLVKERCANYLDEDFFSGCLPLDCDCPMLTKAFCGNAMCRYFRDSVLPNDSELNAAMQNLPAKRCKQCGKLFPAKGKQVYCCESCAAEARRQRTAERVRRHRERKAVM